MVIRTELRTFREELKCEETGCDGTMVFFQGTTISNVLLKSGKWGSISDNWHRCTVCKVEKKLENVRFPRIIYEEIVEDNRTPLERA